MYNFSYNSKCPGWPSFNDHEIETHQWRHRLKLPNHKILSAKYVEAGFPDHDQVEASKYRGLFYKISYH